jgi:hypothetical protein
MVDFPFDSLSWLNDHQFLKISGKITTQYLDSATCTKTVDSTRERNGGNGKKHYGNRS